MIIALLLLSEKKKKRTKCYIKYCTHTLYIVSDIATTRNHKKINPILCGF